MKEQQSSENREENQRGRCLSALDLFTLIVKSFYFSSNSLNIKITRLKLEYVLIVKEGRKEGKERREEGRKKKNHIIYECSKVFRNLNRSNFLIHVILYFYSLPLYIFFLHC